MRRSRVRVVFALFLALIAVAPMAHAEDTSILQGLYGYWSLDNNDNPAWIGKFRDDGTLLHPAEWQFPADWEQGKGFQPERVHGIRRQGVRLRGPERPFTIEVPLPEESAWRFTLSLWAQMAERRDDAVLFSNTALQNFGYGAFRFRVLAEGITVNLGVFDPDKIQGQDHNDLGSSEVMSTHEAFPLNQWQHIALVIDEPQAWLFLNGRQIGYLRLSRPLQRAVINSVTFGDFRRRWQVDDELMLHPHEANGRYVWRAPSQPWSGEIDEVAMWARPLSVAEVRGIYAATLAGKPVFDAVPVRTLWESALFQSGVAALAIVIIGLSLHRWVTQRLRRRLTTAESLLSIDAERKRIADDIHDELGARLAKLSLLSEMAARGDAQSPERLQRVSDTARDAARSLDELVWTLKPSHDSLSDFADYVANAASELLEDTGIALRLNIPDELPALQVPAKVRRELLLVWKEAMANALKHARATEIAVSTALQRSEMILSVADNGVGLPGEFVLESKRKTGNGLRTMCTRIERLGGRCVLGQRDGGGTVVSFSLPLAQIENV